MNVGYEVLNPIPNYLGAQRTSVHIRSHLGVDFAGTHLDCLG